MLSAAGPAKQAWQVKLNAQDDQMNLTRDVLNTNQPFAGRVTLIDKQ